VPHTTRREFIRAASAGATVLGLGGALAGCGGSGGGGGGGSSTSTTVGTQKPGGTLTAGITGSTQTDTVDPLLPTNTVDYGRVSNLYDPLVKQTPDGSPMLWLAEELTPNKDATEWTVRLRSGVTFQDGKPLTADDVIYTLKRILKSKASLAGPLFAPIDVNAMKKKDSLTVTLPCMKPYAILMEAMAISTASTIVPVDFNPKKPVGTGPFKLVSFKPGVQSTMVRNPHYWVEQRPFLDKLILQAFSDPVSQVNALLSGQVDAIDGVTASAVSQIESGGKKTVVSESAAWNGLTMRVDRAPFNDQRVRQAMRLAVNRPQFRDLVYGGRGRLGNDIFGIAAAEYDHSIPQRQQDIEQAKSLLKSAGQSNVSVQLAATTIAQGSVQTCQVVAQQASAAGFNVNVRQLNATDFFSVYPAGHPFYVTYWFQDFYLPMVALSTIKGAPFPEVGFDNPKYNKLYTEAISTVAETKRKEICAQMQEIDYNDGGYLIPSFAPVIDGLSPNVKGDQPGATGLPFNGYFFTDISLD
jgi:peptide/nickel transport system substrate-binding protein